MWKLRFQVCCYKLGSFGNNPQRFFIIYILHPHTFGILADQKQSLLKPGSGVDPLQRASLSVAVWAASFVKLWHRAPSLSIPPLSHSQKKIKEKNKHFSVFFVLISDIVTVPPIVRRTYHNRFCGAAHFYLQGPSLVEVIKNRDIVRTENTCNEELDLFWGSSSH